jgi:uncharacterized protein YndB with AHSA1/START domain/nitroimidazol reductase NimA-like FMN-containing flavoprotein (pyridoxamine 5'-phosphate oxidase superfamily)
VTEHQQTVRVERTIPAPPHRVYRAWLDPACVRQWMAPGDFRTTQVEIDERVGGRYAIRHESAGHVVGGFEAEILELILDRRIVWRWGFVGAEGLNGAVYDSILTVTFADAPGGATRLTLVHERLEALAAALPEVARNVGAGWEDVLRKLAAAAVLADPLAQELLRAPLLARLAYNGLDSFPRVIPIGYYWNGAQIVVCTAATAPKVRALAARPQVALTIDTDTQPPHVLLVRGTARIEIVDGVAPEYLAAAKKSMAGEQLQAFEAQVRATYPQMARIAIEPGWAKLLDFETRMPQFLEELARRSQSNAGRPGVNG